MRITVMTDDIFLYKKIALALRGIADVSRAARDTACHGADLVLYDGRDGSECPNTVAIMPRESARDGALPYPFRLEELAAMVDDGTPAARLVLEDSGEYVWLDGVRIHLTDVEGRLLGALLDGKGEFVSRDSLIETVWHGTAAEGALNVYVHYLREKLERTGEKIITSSRKSGYKIDRKFTGGND